jgi:hypothetical protein
MESQKLNKEDRSIEIEEEKISLLVNLIKQYANHESILGKINPKLKVLYDNRVMNYEKKNELENSWCKYYI